MQKCASVLPEMRVYLAAPIPNDGTTARFQLLISHSAREGEWLVGHKLTGDSNVARVYLRGGTYGHEDTLLAPRGTNDPVDNERCIMGFPVNLTWKKCVAVLGISSPLPNAIRKYDPVYQFGQRTAIHLAVLVERHLREQGEGKERVKAFQGELLGYYNVIKGRPA